MKKLISVLICAIIATSSFAVIPTGVYAASKDVSLKKTSATLKIKKENGKNVFGTTKIKIKKAKGVKITKKSFKISKKSIAKVSKTGKVTAKKQGSAKIIVSVKYKLKGDTYKSKLKFKLTVKDLRKKNTPKKSAAVKPQTVATAATEATTAASQESTAPATEVTQAATETEPSTELPTTIAEETTQTAETTEAPSTTEPATEETTQAPTTTATEETTEDNTSEKVEETTEEVSATEAYETTEPTESATEEATEETKDEEAQGGESYTDATDPATVTEPGTEPDTEPDEGEITEPFNYKKLYNFSNKLYEMCSKDMSGDFVISPISVYMALSMLHNFGDNTVKREVEELVEMSDADIAKSAELMENLVRDYTQYNYFTDEDEVVAKVNLVNSVWFDDHLVTDPDAVKKFVDETNSEQFIAPFADDNKKANQDITDYVKEKTNGLIDRDFDISADTLVTLINTLYFKENWDIDMEELYTKNGNFLYPEGEEEIEYLIGTYVFGRAQETDSCDYYYINTKHGYRIYFVVPKDGHELKEALNAENLNKVLSDNEYNGTDDNGDLHYTRCIFPEFKIDSSLSLARIFADNKYLHNTFIEFFSNITPYNSLAVSDIIHQAVIDVERKGIEGAAVTIIEMEAGCAPDDDETPQPKIYYHDFEINKNFGFLITDYNDTVLFEGQVTAPGV